MRNQVQRDGVNLPVTAPYAVSSGEGVFISQVIFGIANSDAESGAPVVITTEGVFDIAKNPVGALTVGLPAAFDADNKRIDANVGVTEWYVGWVIEDAPEGSTTVRVRLVPQV